MSTLGPILIMAGGTGGHVFPALAVAVELRRAGRDVVWLGTRNGLEARVVPAAGIEVEWLTVGGLRGKGLVNWLFAPWRLLRSVFQAFRIVRRLKVSAVLGMGGYVSGPGGLAAWLLRRPLVIHEQNAIAGLTNRVLAHLATDVLQAFPGTFEAVLRPRTVGNPVREDILRLESPRTRMHMRTGPTRVLVLGGSQGAAILNRVVPEAAAEVALPIDIWHQSGERNLDTTRAAYREAGVSARIDPFISDMAEAYGWADIVICRAGALTVTELATAGVGAILIPFPAAVDDHQTLNARHLSENGAAVLLPQRELTADALCRVLDELCADRIRLVAMAEEARQLARPDATRLVARACLACTGGEVAA
ncbi:MAG: undecaprenyldiphospho-muramoylpentapeptide beta-N-acetylglucosaminyltransferase [Gammaproteobacteria bacterium]|jgi:UDP-N-acetylglucosamine--N-acetylmuramyl-(pentapeptide) pyrophosphoryl-undecaprenol N-acetylglucosamine transferase